MPARGYCVSMINKIIHACSWIRNFSCGQHDFLLVRCAHSWAIELNTRRESPYLRAPFYILYLFMTTYHSYGVTFSDSQKEKLPRALQQRYPITLRLSNNELHCNDEFMLTKTHIKKIQRAMSTGVGVDIKISKSQIVFTSCCERGSSLFSSLMTLAPRLLSNVSAKVLPGLATV